MALDHFGHSISLTDAEARDHWHAATMAFLAHGAATPVHLGACLTRAPDFAMGQATKGLFTLLLGRRELRPTAAEALAAARAGLARGPAPLRERLYVEALELWLEAGRPSQAAATLERVLDTQPDDPLTLKIAHALRFILGDAGQMRRTIEQVLPAYGLDHPARGYLLGCHAFALEETGEYCRAEIAGRQALWTAPDDAWGLHAVAHVFDMTGNARGGLNWLTGREAAWSHCNNFRYHVWWHKALMHLDLGQTDAVLDLYDAEIRAERTDDYRDISNATSLLSRLELEGVDVGHRWDELADLAAARTEDGSLIFADLHYVLALVAGDRETALSQILARMARDAEAPACDIAERMRDPGLSAATGLAAFGAGNYSGAFAHLLSARPAMPRAGGSHAQRDVFERLTIDAGLRAGYLGQAEALLADRQHRRGGREDGYAAARRAMIAAARHVTMPSRATVSAQ